MVLIAVLARAVPTGAPTFPRQFIKITPTVDRLAEPTLPAEPRQADLGARAYWLSCMPCHGDKGQGLTTEFRRLYPPDHQNCWSSGCHGARPYNNGFRLPPAVPPLIGPGALATFRTAADLQGYIASAMPFWDPGSLTEQQSWQVTAFLLRSNGIWEGESDLDGQSASTIQISTVRHAAGAEMQTAIGSSTASPVPATPTRASTQPESSAPNVVVPLVILALVLVSGILLRRQHAPDTN
jgi:mono/diheme cytochrome c family protein